MTMTPDARGCPSCGSLETHFRRNRGDWACDDCDHKWIPAEEAGEGATAPVGGATRVFLSYARGDDKDFVRRLYDDLVARGFEVWFDCVSMPSRQLTFHHEIRNAVTVCDRLVLVVGPKAAQSDHVTQEWQFGYYVSNKCINPILRLDGTADDGETIDGYTLVPEVLGKLHAEDFRDDAQYATHLDNLLRQLSEPLPPVGKLVGVPELPPGFRAQPERLEVLRDLLLADLRGPRAVFGAAARVGVQGMGGIGKSVLANAVARHPEVRRAFKDGVFWIAIGQHPDVLGLQRRLAQQFGHDAPFNDEHAGKEKLRELLADREVLLILDDVWESPHAQAFNVIDPRSRILLTTRDAGLVTALASRENHFPVHLPSHAEAAAILASAAKTRLADLPSEAEDIINLCGRLPLALALCGGMVQSGVPWQDALDALRGHNLQYLSADHPAEEQHQNIWKAMDVSLRVLPETERERFAELAVFALDTGAVDAAVATLWEHTGGLSPRDSRKLLSDFARRSLVQLTELDLGQDSTTGILPVGHGQDAHATTSNRVILHDLLHSFATGMAEERPGSEATLHNLLLDAYREQCPDGWAFVPDDGYIKRNLPLHLAAAEDYDELLTVMHAPDLGYLRRWIEHGDGDIGLQCISKAIAHLQETGKSPLQMAGLSTQIARILSLRGRFTEVEDWLVDYALKLTAWNRGRRIRAIALHELASLYLSQEEYRRASSHYWKAWMLCMLNPSKLRDEIAANLVGLSTVAHAEFRYVRSLWLGRLALCCAKWANDQPHIVAAYRLRATACLYLGRYVQCAQLLTLAVSLTHQWKLPLERARLKLVHGWLALIQDRLRAETPRRGCFRFFQEALQDAQSTSDLYATLEAKLSLGWCELALGDPTAADSGFQEVLDALPEGAFHRLLAGTKIGMAAVRHREGDLAGARAEYEAAALTCKASRIITWEWRALVGLGAVRWHLGERALAAENWRDAVAIAGKISRAYRTLAKRCILDCQQDRLSVTC